jgi:hypothetical protein
MRDAISRDATREWDQLNTTVLQLSCLDLWICWHIREERCRKGSIEFTSPPWKVLKQGDFDKSRAAKTLGAGTSLYNAPYLCMILDDATLLKCTRTRKPTVKQLTAWFMGTSIQNILEELITTEKG